MAEKMEEFDLNDLPEELREELFTVKEKLGPDWSIEEWLLWLVKQGLKANERKKGE